jgi:hypothetical protein
MIADIRRCPLYNKEISDDDCWHINTYALDGMSDLPGYATADFIEENEDTCLSCKYCQRPAEE